MVYTYSHLLQNGHADGRENTENNSGLQRAPKVNALLCISTAVLLYCTQVENKANTRTYVVCNYFSLRNSIRQL